MEHLTDLPALVQGSARAKQSMKKGVLCGVSSINLIILHSVWELWNVIDCARMTESESVGVIWGIVGGGGLKNAAS